MLAQEILGLGCSRYRDDGDLRAEYARACCDSRNYVGCVTGWKKFEALRGVALPEDAYWRITRCHRNMGKFSDAQESLSVGLRRFPKNQKLNREQALLRARAQLIRARAQSNTLEFQNTKQSQIAAHLYFGFIPNARKARNTARRYQKFLTDTDVRPFDPQSTKSIRSHLLAAVSDCIPQEGPIHIGVSFGLDSRAILAALLELVSPNRIFAFTFGHSGNWDFENARSIVRSTGINYRVIENKGVTGTGTYGVPKGQSGVVKVRQIQGDAQFYFLEKNTPLLHGYLGGPLTTASDPDANTSWPRARELAARTDLRQSVRADLDNLGFLPKAWIPEDFLPKKEFLPATTMGFAAQLNLFFRQDQYIKHPLYLKPFLSPAWQKSWIGLDPDYLSNRRLYKYFLSSEYPDFFPDLIRPELFVPPKNSTTNVSVAKLFRESKEYRQHALSKLADLQALGLYFNPFALADLMDAGVDEAGKLLKGLLRLPNNLLT